MRPHRFLVLSALALSFAGAACAQAAMPPPKHRQTAPAAQGDVVSTLAARGQYRAFLKLVAAAGMTERLRDAPALTLFAPTDPVFDALPPAAAERLRTADPSVLRSVVLAHVVDTRLTREALLARRTPLRTAAGTELRVAAEAGEIRVGPASVKEADIPATNGVIFAVDRLLAPNG
jgi:uncharacterized surface protein with fasciclin (FAS1) repeats